MKLVTFNLMHGRSPGDGLVDPDRIAAAIRSLDADVLAIQEVDRGHGRSHRRDLTRLAAEAMGVPEGGRRFAATITGVPGEAWRPAACDDDHAAQYGVGLLCRRPVTRWLVHRLPSAPVLFPGPDGGRLLRDEPRLVLAGLLDGLTVACTHLSLVPGWNLYQLGLALRWLARLPAPQVLLGDLNIAAALTRPAAALAGWRTLARTATYPAPRPWVQLDHVLWHGSRPPAVCGFDTPAMDISDHRPLAVELALP
ncbi:MAG TPA: endonuclease/exonuclease/phosphatase family protein [Rugosimonospora sp.]|nr:endonuclease/exonuclease/phosphatase family protein [Rugosimonospora sp.]